MEKVEKEGGTCYWDRLFQNPDIGRSKKRSESSTRSYNLYTEREKERERYFHANRNCGVYIRIYL